MPECKDCGDPKQRKSFDVFGIGAKCNLNLGVRKFKARGNREATDKK